MRIATYNANSIRARTNVLLQWLKEQRPDVLCLQETRVQDEEFPFDAFSESGYEVIFRGQKKRNGVAILSSRPVEEVECVLEADEQNEARFLKARIDKLFVVNTYIPQGSTPDSDRFQYKLNYYNWLYEYFSGNFTPKDRLIWTGDMNAALEPIDVYDPAGLWGSVCYCREVQEAVGKFLKWGLEDVFRLLSPEPGQYTFWDYRVPNAVKRKKGWRLDYIFATKPLAKKCVKCWIDVEARLKPMSSDHTFLAAEFDI